MSREFRGSGNRLIGMISRVAKLTMHTTNGASRAKHDPGRWLLALLGCAWGLLLTNQAWADTHALLVAVSKVQALPARLWLRGPENDVALMRAVLQERGVPAQNIASLSAARGDTPATHTAIVQAMLQVAQRAQAGDTVVLHLAGHGVQVPQRRGAEAEPDGLDEVFLTADTQAWNAAQGVLPQGLYDHDIGAWMDALVARGVRVFGVFDTCHASGMHRGAPGASTRWRGVAAAELGVPAHSTARPARVALRTPATNGRVLALAARAHESTPEEWLPKGSPQARLHGVFTYAVVQGLREGVADATELRLAVARQYGAGGRTTPVPVVLGTGGLSLQKTP